MKTLISLAGALLASTLTAASGIGYASQAQAQPAIAAQQIVAVPYGDLDLTTPAGRAALDTRIGHAARNACEASPADLRGQNAAGRCRADLVASLTRQSQQALARRSSSGAVLAARR